MSNETTEATADELEAARLAAIDEDIAAKLSVDYDGPIIIYDASENHYGASLPGVPLRDLTAAEFAEYPRWLQRSVIALRFYRWS
jgi:hypothetical protein